MKTIGLLLLFVSSLAGQAYVLGTAADPCTGTILNLPVTPAPAMPSLRYDPAGFTCTVNGSIGKGTYQVTLDFVEPGFYAPGGRLFSVFINDQPVLSSIDLAKCGAINVGVKITRTFALMTNDGRFVIRLQNLVRNAVLSAITVTPLTPLTDPLAARLETMEVNPVIGQNGKASFVIDFDPSIYNLNVLMTVEVAGKTPVRAGYDYNLSATRYIATQSTVTLDSGTQTNILAKSVWPAGTVTKVRWSRLR